MSSPVMRKRSSPRSGGFSAVHVGPGERALEKLWAIPADEIKHCFPRTDWACRGSLLVVVTGRMGPAVQRYGSRGYRFVLLEAGAAAMVATLVALEVGLVSCMVGGFDDSALAGVLDLSPDEAELPLIAVAIGHRAEE